MSIIGYFEDLSHVLSGIALTDRAGRELSLEQGSQSAVDRLMDVRSCGAKVLIVGNGGSSAIASHIQVDIAKAVGVRALAFDMMPLVTALSNDHGYGCVYERPVAQWAEKDDLLIAISSSGKSENILRAAQAAMERNCQVLTMSGFGADNPLRKMGDLNFYVPSGEYGQVELSHSILGHFITDSALKRMAGRA